MCSSRSFTTKGTRGTGLGLSTVYGVVQHGARSNRHPERAGEGHVGETVLPADGWPWTPGCRWDHAPYDIRRSAGCAAGGRRSRRTYDARAGAQKAGHDVVEVGDVEAGRVVVRERGAEFAVLVTDGIMPGGSTRQLIDDYLIARPDGRVVVCSAISMTSCRCATSARKRSSLCRSRSRRPSSSRGWTRRRLAHPPSPSARSL